MINIRMAGIWKGYVSGVIAMPCRVKAPRTKVDCEKAREGQVKYHPDKDESIANSDVLHVDLERAIECGCD